MTNKKDIANLINGIVGEPQALRKSDENGNVAPEVVERLGITPELEEELNALRRANVGRPKGGRKADPDKNPYEGRATFVVDTRLIRKVKYISLMDSKLLKDVISEALSAYISKWERANEKIELPEKK